MTVLRLRKAAEEIGAGESTMWRAIESGGMSTELTEDGGAPNVSLRQLPAPGTIAASDLAARLADADAAISTIQELLGEVRTSHDVGPWTTSSGIATSGAGGPSGLQKGRGGGASQAETARRRLRRRSTRSCSSPARARPASAVPPAPRAESRLRSGRSQSDR
jgi:hypothetical protein